MKTHILLELVGLLRGSRVASMISLKPRLLTTRASCNEHSTVTLNITQNVSYAVVDILFYSFNICITQLCCMPTEWMENVQGIIILLYKRKGSRSDCSNYWQCRFTTESGVRQGCVGTRLFSHRRAYPPSWSCIILAFHSSSCTVHSGNYQEGCIQDWCSRSMVSA